MKSKELREMKKEELSKFIEDKKAEAVKLGFDISTKQFSNHRQYRQIKKDIARALTILGETDENKNK